MTRRFILVAWLVGCQSSKPSFSDSGAVVAERPHNWIGTQIPVPDLDIPEARPTRLFVGQKGGCLTADRITQCWGNIGGELYEPQAPFDLLPEGIVDLAIGSQHACAILDNGDVGCWGRNSAGELGFEPMDDIAGFTKVDAVSNAISITVDYRNSCVATHEGEVICWGDNASGQTGHPPRDVPPATACPEPIPHVVADLPPAIAVSNGPDFTCALLTDGTSRCWGNDLHGERGRAHTQVNADGVLLADPGLERLVQLESTSSTNVAMNEDGVIYGWGRHAFGYMVPEEEWDYCSNVVDQACFRDPIVIPFEEPPSVMHFSGSVLCTQAEGDLMSCDGYGMTTTDGDTMPSTITEPHIQFGMGANYLCLMTENETVKCMGAGHLGQFGTVMEWQSEWVTIELP